MASFISLRAEEPWQQPREESGEDEFVLEGAPIEAGRIPELHARGRTVKVVLHPLLAQGQAWITETHANARSQSSFVV
jgi:hypothetical protein